jgi:hypothetical protein
MVTYDHIFSDLFSGLGYSGGGDTVKQQTFLKPARSNRPAAGYSHLDRVFPAVICKRDHLVGLLDAWMDTEV